MCVDMCMDMYIDMCKDHTYQPFRHLCSACCADRLHKDGSTRYCTDCPLHRLMFDHLLRRLLHCAPVVLTVAPAVAPTVAPTVALTIAPTVALTIAPTFVPTEALTDVPERCIVLLHQPMAPDGSVGRCRLVLHLVLRQPMQWSLPLSSIRSVRVSMAAP